MKRSILWRIGTAIKNYGETKKIKYFIGLGYRIRGHVS